MDNLKKYEREDKSVYYDNVKNFWEKNKVWEVH